MKFPMLPKYVDEKVGNWMIFGEHADGTVDVNDGQRDVFTNVPRDKAEQMVALHSEFMSNLYKITSEGFIV